MKCESKECVSVARLRIFWPIGDVVKDFLGQAQSSGVVAPMIMCVDCACKAVTIVALLGVKMEIEMVCPCEGCRNAIRSALAAQEHAIQ